MSRRGSILIVHQIPSGTKRGSHEPYTREGAIPSPCNCKTPCCYGRARSYCWPCMKKIVEDHNANKKR